MPVFQSLSEINLFNAIVYQVTEPLDFFREKINLSESEMSYFSAKRHPERQKESYAARYALHLAMNQQNRVFLETDPYGKPYLVGSESFISLSHTSGYVAAVVSPHPCGIDIQRFDTKILNLGAKFLAKKELADIPPDSELSFLTHSWAIKEAAYKTFGKKGLEFGSDIEIQEMNFMEGSWESKVYVHKNDEYFKYQVKGWTNEAFVLAICLEL